MALCKAFKGEANGGQIAAFRPARYTSLKTARRPLAKAGHRRRFIGADPEKRDYILYLAERYNWCREMEFSLGLGKTRPSYAFVFTNIQNRFKAPIYFIPMERFEELVDYLQDMIDQTPLNKRKRGAGRANYKTFDEYQSAARQAAG
jgi:hypothetical protein